MEEMTGREALMRVLEDEGVEFMFGNPGTTELPIMDVLVEHPRLRYVLGLQESVVVAMADGYSRASGRLSCANVHVAPGLGNAMGSIYNAKFFGAPLIVTAGQQPHGLSLTQPMLHDDLVTMARPVVKWATEVERVEDLPLVMRRAAKVARSAPSGPVFVSLPGDVLLNTAPLALGASTPVDSRSRPGDAALEALAGRLLAAAAPMIIAGDQVCTGDAWAELVALAELLGAPVYHQSVAYLAVFPSEHPLYMGELTRNQTRVRNILESHDLLFIVGGDGLRMSVPGAVEPVPPGLPIVQVTTQDWELGKNYPAEIALDADARETLAALLPVLEQRMNAKAREAAGQRAQAAAAANWSVKREALLAQAGEHSEAAPIRGEYLMRAITEVLPEHAVVVDEGLTSSRSLLGMLPVRERQRYYGLASGGIGWGIAGAVGVQLALPERPVLAVIGDGSSLYSIQALWSAANLNLPITYVIANNGGYSILKERLIAFGGSSVARETMIGMDFHPAIGFCALAEAMGLKSRRVEQPGGLHDALRWGLAEPGAVLLDVAVYDPYRTG